MAPQAGAPAPVQTVSVVPAPAPPLTAPVAPGAPSWLALALIAAVALAALVGAIVVRRQKRAADKVAAAAAPAPGSDIPELVSASFAAAMRRLYPGRSRLGRYEQPCVLVAGAGAHDRAALLAAAGLERVPGGGQFHSGWWSTAQGAAFDLPAEAWAGGAQAWSEFLDLVDQHRPLRGFDALVWAIPLSTLEAGDSALAADAVRTSRKLMDLQTRLGLQVPLYVVVTECDQATGFGALAAALPGPVREQALGWSSPFPLGTSYQNAWAEEGLAASMHRLRTLVAEVGVEGRAGDDFGPLYLLPERLAARLAHLPGLLHQALRRNATLRAIDLRGFYLSGEAADGAGAPAAPEQSTAAPDPFTEAPARGAGRIHPGLGRAVFCRQLFNDRIFAEFGLARQISRKLTEVRGARAWAMWGGTALAVLWLVLLWPATHDLAVRRSHIDPVLAKVERSMQRYHSAYAADAVAARAKDAAHTLAAIEQVPDWSLRSSLIPASWSWLGGLDDKIDSALGKYYQQVVLTDLVGALGARRDVLFNPVNLAPASPIEVNAKTGTLPQFIAMRHFVDQTVAYETALERLDHLMTDGSGDWDDVAGLLDYLFQVQVPRSGDNRGLHHLDALVRTTNLQRTGEVNRLTGLEEPARFQAQLDKLHRRWIDHRFDRSVIVDLSEEIRSQATLIDAGGGLANLPQLAANITRLESMLGQLGLVWDDDKLDLGPAYSALQARIAQSAMLGEAKRAELEERTIAAQAQLRSEIQGSRAQNEAVLTSDAANHLVVNAELTALPDAFAQLQRFPFAQGSVGTPAGADARQVLVWNQSRLEAARAVMEDYGAYEGRALDKAPARFQGALRKYAGARAAERQAAELAAAAAPAGVDAGWRGANFDLARQAMPPLLADLRKLGRPELAEHWQGVMDQQAMLLLDLLQAELLGRPLYLPDATVVASWNGSRNGALQPFGAILAADLPDYLQAQLDEVAVLAAAAKGPLAWLEHAPAARRASSSAQAFVKISSELQRHAAKDPAGSVARLEKLITLDLNTIDSANCHLQLAGMGRSRSIDYFQRQGQQATRLYARRCGELQHDGARSAYRTIAELYNATLLERYPFAAAPDAAPAAPDQVRHLLRLLDTHAAEVRQYLERQGGAGTQALTFIDSLEATRPLLAAMLAREALTGAPVALDLWPEFRINRGAERGADQIIAFEIEGATAGNSASAPASPPLAWRMGESLGVNLRWARNSPYAPAPDRQRFPAMQVDDKRASWRYSGPWALLRMLAAHAAPLSELSARDAAAPQPLRFVVPVQEAGAKAPVDAVAYGRLGVSVHGKSERLALPAFPNARAPALPAALPQPAAPLSAGIDIK